MVGSERNLATASRLCKETQPKEAIELIALIVLEGVI